MQHMMGTSTQPTSFFEKSNKIDKPLARVIKKTEARQK